MKTVRLTLITFLCMAIFDCNKPPAQSNNEGATASTPGTAPNATPSASSEPNTTRAAQPREKAPATKPAATVVTIPAGTVLTVRLGESVGSKTSQPGQSFSATLADPVVVEGKTVIPTGANATGTVVDAKPLGRFKGGASLTLKLTSITFNGSEHAI